MTSAVLLTAFLAQPECLVPSKQAKRIIRAAEVARAQFKLPEGLLLAVVLAETGGRDVVARGRGKGWVGCDVGVAQIHIPGCKTSELLKTRPILQNLLRGAQILSWSRSRCRRSPRWTGCRCIWGRYNPGSRTWCKKVLKIWDRLRRAPNA